MTTLEQAKKIVEILDEMKAHDLKLLKIDEISSLGDYFVISTGTSSTAVQAQSDKVEIKMKEQGIMPLRVEGYRSTGWILIDYGSVIVHIFTDEARDFYDLDRLWQDAEQII
ncbi:MAG: ribosome silencing factor [Clostridia bacterium]